MSIGIAYNPCKNCKETDKCIICELTYYRKGYVKSPTADVVEVVRCKDCLFANTEDGKIKCHNTYGLLVTEEKNYCSRGRRRDHEK